MTTLSSPRRILALVVAVAASGACDRELLIGTVDGHGHHPSSDAGSGSGGTGGDAGPLRVVQVEPGWYHICAHLSDGSVRCWGDNQGGELGDGTYVAHDDPRTVSGLSDVANIQNDYGYSCAVLTDGTSRCWGSDNYGQFGDGRTMVLSTTPVVAFGGATLKQLSLGEYHSCALFTDGHVACSGLNSSGQLGDGTKTDASVPVTVSGLAGVQQIAAGANFTCALLADQTVSCWGINAAGDFCSGAQDVQAKPVSVAGVSNAVKITAGSAHACALLASGSVTCWGSNDRGQLTAPSPASSPCVAYAHGPITAPSLNGVVDVSAGDGHTCALLATGTAVCWGYNKYGQLGDGTTNDHATPQAVPGLSGIAQLVAGYMDTCAIVADGALECWGAVNPYFSTVTHLVPTPVDF